VKGRQAAIALLVMALGAFAPLDAQTPIDITADFDVSYVIGLEENTYSGTGTLEPFGNALIQTAETFSGDAVVFLNATFSIATCLAIKTMDYSERAARRGLRGL
jgi:hypothetical protein